MQTQVFFFTLFLTSPYIHYRKSRRQRSDHDYAINATLILIIRHKQQIIREVMATLVENSNGVLSKQNIYQFIYQQQNMPVGDGKPFNIGHFTNCLW